MKVTEHYERKLEKMLSEIKSKNGKVNLMEHLNKIYATKRALNDDAKFDDLFEDISLRIKQNGTYAKQKESANCKFRHGDKIDDKILEEKKLMQPLVKAEEGAEPQPVGSVNFIPDYLELFDKFSYCGLNFGPKEAILISNSLRNLSATLGAGTVSFFGKIFGTEKDYYIAEATDIDPPAEFNYDNDMEKRKEDGINRNVFFVTNDLCSKWVELPDIKPKQLIQSRQIKYFFTGNLDRKICTTPDFQGQEKHLLRCQLARIYHGAKLVPSINHYTIEDAESPFRQLTPAEKPKKLTYKELSDLKFWIHYPPGILKNGRVSHIIDDPPEGVEPEEHKKKIMDADPFDKRLEPVDNDRKILSGYGEVLDYEGIVPWKLEQFYEDNVYINPYVKMLDETQPDFDPAEQKENNMNYSLITLRSLRWPGAINIYNNKECYFFYFGNGNKVEDNWPVGKGSFRFNEFPVIPSEVKDKVDNKEPHEPGVPPAQPQEEKK